MGQKTSKGEKRENHVAFPTQQDLSNLPNITITTPTPIHQPNTNPFTAPPPTPKDSQSIHSYYEETPILISSQSRNDSTQSPSITPPPPPTIPPPDVPPKIGIWHDEVTRKKFGANVLERCSSAIPPPPSEYAPPIIKRPIYYAKDKIAIFESINTIDRNKSNKDYYSIKDASKNNSTSKYITSSSLINGSATKLFEAGSQASQTTTDDYPIYNVLSDYNYKSGKSFHAGVFPIDANRVNFGFCGRSGAGKSSLINSLRGLSNGDPQSAGRNHCDRMEPFRFIEGELQQTVLWEIPYPRTFSSVNDVFDANMGFDKFYETHKLKLFKRLFILIPDGAPTEEDITFARVAHSRRTSITFLSTKSDEDLDAENRETGRKLDQQMKKNYENTARGVFSRYVQSKAQILNSIELLFVSAPVVRNLVSGTVGYLHYLLNEENLVALIGLNTGCHYELEMKIRNERENYQAPRKPQIEFDKPKTSENTNEDKENCETYSIARPTVLADAGFEIVYGTDDRIYQSLEPKTMIRRAGKTCFNYGFIGRSNVGKSSLIDAMRGMSTKHPLSATKSKTKAGSCDQFEFDDNILKYSVTLHELHYPKKINSYFEFIDKYNVASLTALFIIIDQTPSDQDLAFAKIAYRRNTTILFLISKCDKKLSSRSRSDEIPVCDLLKQRYIDKALNKFDRIMTENAPELQGRVNVFFVSAPVFRALRSGEPRESQFVLHERAVFDFLKSRRMIADMLDDPPDIKEGSQTNFNLETAGML